MDTPGTPRIVAPEDNPDAVNTAVLDALTEQLADASGDLREQLLSTYLDQGIGLMATLLAAAGEGDLVTAAKVAHRMRSSSALLGAGVLSGLLGKAEALGREETAELAPSRG